MENFEVALEHAKDAARSSNELRFLIFVGQNKWSVVSEIPDHYRRPYVRVDRYGAATPNYHLAEKS